MVVGLLVGFASLGGPLVGCATPTGRPATGSLTPQDWPPRISAGLDRLVARTPPSLDDDRGDLSLLMDVADDEQIGGVPLRVVRAVRRGFGIVLELESFLGGEARASGAGTQLVFVSFSPLTRAGRRAAADLPDRITASDVRTGVRWRLYEPEHKPARGLAVHLGGNKYVRRALLERGWAVLHSSGTGRFFQRRARAQTFEVECGGDFETLAGQLAAIIDDELADWPYALEAVLEYLAEYRTDLWQRPIVVMGFSVGALGLPAVVARLPERFQAAVLVAGGANLLEISQRSWKENRGIELRWKGCQPTRDDWERLYAAYLEEVRLDPYHTAAALVDMPVLVCQACFDQVVPAASGETLYARLGEPERWVYPVGHKHLLKLVMRLEAGRIADWVQAVVSEQSATGPAVGAK